MNTELIRTSLEPSRTTHSLLALCKTTLCLEFSLDSERFWGTLGVVKSVSFLDIKGSLEIK